MLLFLIVLFLSAEFVCRLHYYIRKKQYTARERAKLILLGRWCISESGSSPLYMNEIAQALSVDREFLVEVLSAASGKESETIRSLFLSESGRREQYRYVPLIGQLPAPNQDIGHLKTNSLGFRDRQRSTNKPRGVKRIVLLGGSVAYGRTATSNNATIASNLERMLNKRDSSGVLWEVINLAVPDVISYQELLILIKYGLPYKPDYVISLSGINDAHHFMNTGKINEPSALRDVKLAYSAFFGSPFRRLGLILSAYFVSAVYVRHLLQSEKQVSEEELSPYIYTIW